jgi:hypothetical protein
MGVLIMGMSMHDRYYEPEDDNDAERIAEEAYDMVMHDPDYDPSDLSKFSEAIGQDCDDVELQQFVRDCIEAKDWAKLGLKLYTHSFEYWEDAAKHHLE